MVELLQRLLARDPDRLRARLRVAERELEKTRRATQVLRALEQASAAMRKGGTPDELFDVVGSTLAEFGLTTVVLMYEPGDEELGVTYLLARVGSKREKRGGFSEGLFYLGDDTGRGN